MRKLARLREHMTEALAHRGLADNPSDLHFVIPSGSALANARGQGDRAFEYKYTLHMGIFDCAGSFDEIVIPLLIWIERWQPDLLNLTADKGGIDWEIEELDNGKFDTTIRIPLSETLSLKLRPDGGHDLTRPEEQAPFALEPAAPLHRVYLEGELIVSCGHDLGEGAP